MTNTYSEEIVQLKKFVIDQLLSSKNTNMEYKLCSDYLRNYKNEKYREMITKKTGKSSTDLYKEASMFIADTNNWLYHKLNEMDKELRARIVNEPKAMDLFLDEIHEQIKENHNGIFLFRT